MRPLLVVLGIAALFALCAAQTQLKLEGNWMRTACICSNPATNGNCDDIWITQYDKVIYSSATSSWSGQATTKNLIFTLAGSDMVVVTPSGLGYYCHGAMGREMICENAARDKEFCRVTFACVDGDCVTSLASRNMRSVMYPIVGTIIAATWVAVAVVSKLLPVPLIVMVNAIVINVLGFFCLIGWLVWPPLMAMAFGSLSLVASKGNNWSKGLGIVCGIFVFLHFAGLNGFTGGVGIGITGLNFFDRAMVGYFFDLCTPYFGLSLHNARCGPYLTFTAFCGFLITVLAPLQVILLMASYHKKE